MNHNDFERIYHENFRMLTHFAYNFVKDETVAEDIVSNVFINLWNEKPPLLSTDEIGRHLLSSTKNSINRHIRMDNIKTEFLIAHPNKITTIPNPYLKESEVLTGMLKSINNLSPNLKKVMELTIEGVPTSEIAAQMSLTEDNISVLKARARKYLRKDLFVNTEELLDINYHKQQETREQIIKIKEEVDDEFIKYYTKHPHKLYNISPRQYEIFVAELLKDMGYEVWLNNHTRDGGRDIIAVLKTPANDSFVTIVECKKYSLDNPVPLEVVERFTYTVRDKDKANAGWIVTTSTFSRDAKKHQHEYKWLLSLKDNKDLATLCSNYGKWKRTSEGSGLWLPDNPLE